MTTWQSKRPPPLSPISCPTCSAILAETDGCRIYLTASLIAQTVVLHCREPGCHGRFTWHAPPPRRDGRKERV